MRVLYGLLAASTFLAGENCSPNPEAILNRHLEMSGGKEAYARVKSVSMLGTMEVKGQNVKGEARIYRKNGGKSYTVVDLPGIGKQEDGSNGTVVWDKTVLGPRIKTGVERFLTICSSSALGEYTRGALEKDTCYDKFEFAGEEVVDGRKLCKLRLTPKQGKAEEHLFDSETGLLARTKMIMPSPMGEVPIVAIIEEYRNVDGVKTPVKITNQMGVVAMTMSFTSVKFNEAIPEAMFALPPEISALVKAGKK
ncbi:MAG: hypothetical protein K7J46_04475 [Bryobacter sp.]|jgi:hypothetical protein|nr:hypothetical protein [Bryobacter sp. CoA8 C33]